MKKYVKLVPNQLIEQLSEVNEIPKGVELIKAPEIWGQAKGTGIKVAVLDTGCDTSHPDLKDRIAGGRNFTEDDNGDPNSFMDYNGHGTHVCGTIAASMNGQGVVGVAPEAEILMLKVLGKDGSGQYEWITNAIQYAIDQKVDIISMSLGGPSDEKELHDVIKKAVLENGILVVCAAGNEGDGRSETDEFGYPGGYNEVISVGSVNLERGSSDFSNSNNEVDVVAPGEKITSTFLGGKYATFSGTSMATPHVAGSLALLKELTQKTFERKLTEPELYAQLVKRTVPLGYSPKEEGNGLVYLTLVEEMKKIYNEKKMELLFNR
ncbi:S8 family peptidase [Falsibacillus pallidus]|uniref:Major intracellular serine protease n=1 Tax=Falsibacillus pallidus TaxID=493781 RepID=A0A370GSX2_9BACI|nr:S8 family peptidase [Falsibacillus pallidus]RDI45624.1 major intracellular serine protease [Falsibacillus pallidus]